MFTQKKKAYYSKILGFKNIDDFVNLKNYIKTLDKKPTITELSKYFNISSRAIRNNIKKEDLI